MAGRHRPGRHTAETKKAKDFYKITPVKAVRNKEVAKSKERVKGDKLTPLDDRS